jgi:hypothetical protein
MDIKHLEINFQRLLKKCEEMAEIRDETNWRFEKVCRPNRPNLIQKKCNFIYYLISIVCDFSGRNARQFKQAHSQQALSGYNQKLL